MIFVPISWLKLIQLHHVHSSMKNEQVNEFVLKLISNVKTAQNMPISRFDTPPFFIEKFLKPVNHSNLEWISRLKFVNLTFNHSSNNSSNWWLSHKLVTPLIKGRNPYSNIWPPILFFSGLFYSGQFYSLDPVLRMKLCLIRSTMLSMFHLDKLKCNRGNQKVNIMITAPNQKACKYATHRNGWIQQAAALYQHFEIQYGSNVFLWCFSGH